MLLNPLAMWASKRSQVLAPHTRFNRGQPHGRTASRALRTLVLFIKRWHFPQVGARNSPWSQCFRGFRGIDIWLDALMSVIACGALECSDVETTGTGCNACQHHSCLARGAKWSLDDHNARLGSGGSVTELSVTDRCREWTVMKSLWHHACPDAVPFCSL